MCLLDGLGQLRPESSPTTRSSSGQERPSMHIHRLAHSAASHCYISFHHYSAHNSTTVADYLTVPEHSMFNWLLSCCYYSPWLTLCLRCNRRTPCKDVLLMEARRTLCQRKSLLSLLLRLLQNLYQLLQDCVLPHQLCLILVKAVTIATSHPC
jgi:hypothetical protein